MTKPIPASISVRSRLAASLSELAANVPAGAGMLHNVVTGGSL